MTTHSTTHSHRPTLLAALTLAIPAFYLMLAGPDQRFRALGSVLYGLMAAALALDLIGRWRQAHRHSLWRRAPGELLLLVGALASAWLTEPPWSELQWLLRLGFCGIVFARLVLVLKNWVERRRLLQLLAGAGTLMAVAGGGFYWLEPQVHSYADGLWLAFITAATVGYGDLVPSTPASRIFAAFIVLLGYAVFSVVTASIAALFIGEDEQRFERELHGDIRELRQEIAALREELRVSELGKARTGGEPP
jgi:voltage-gated potassium channel